MTKEQQLCRALQVLLWLWFGTISSFVCANVVNIARLETENKLLQDNIDTLENRLISLKYHTISK